ncbi:GNAT family N-acetyltransferase [Pseudoalteromonas sp. OFAV1]|uniref:GNAT family N-acetyltransferase n=1 Tax=Pseudoalteromonas sp. OFAV1 TaxID=2908892 RepID=UPI001F40E7F5|nr:GNAT family N-acetyltransferase [Pseudoalteromonas sp. OFAV1]MCF2899265.1 GNAT family N-acetyltransferase [Pseudoalteromonas sp. OFAV1]
MEYRLIEQLPSAEEYCAMRLKAGLSARSLAAAKAGLPNSLYAICVRKDDELIGMGRVIGDGGCNFEVVDIAVSPEYQGKGLGRQIMEHVDRYIESAAFEGSYVTMVADKPGFYEKLGYKFVAPQSQGMYKKF